MTKEHLDELKVYDELEDWFKQIKIGIES